MEILNQIKQLELRAGKYDSLKECFEEEIPKVHKLILDIESKLSDIKLVLKNINPILSLENVSEGKRMSIKPIIERVYKEMMEKFDINENSKGWIIKKLREMPNVQTRREGKKIYLYYFKGSITKDRVEISDGVSIPKKFSHMT